MTDRRKSQKPPAQALPSVPRMRSVPPQSEPEPSPASRPRNREDLAMRWAATLDHVDHFALLKLPYPETGAGPSYGAVRRAFQVFASAFHPDHYRNTPERVRAAASRVYDRGLEARRVLLDPELCKRYLASLTEENRRRSDDAVRPEKMPESGSKPAPVTEIVKTTGARAFAELADELIAKGDLKRARLQVQIALSHEPQNGRLAERLLQIERAIGAARQ